MEEENKDGLKDLVKKLIEQNDRLIETKQVKSWKLPGRGKVGGGRIKKGWASFIIVRNNGNIAFTRAPIDDEGTVLIEGFPRVATIDYKLSYKGKPLYIIPEWSMKPFSPVENYDETTKQQMNMGGRRLVLARMQKELIKPKKDLGGLLWVIVGIAVIAIGYYIWKRGGI